MSASNSEKLKTNCDAVRIINSSSTLNSLTSSSSASLSTLSNSNVIKAVNNGAKLNNNQQKQQQQNQHPYRHHQQQQLILRQQQQQKQQKNQKNNNQQIQPKQQKKQDIAAVNKQDYSAENFQIESQKLSSDVQKVLKQEQELQKQLYSGSNVAPGWLRVNHNSKVIYIRWDMIFFII